MKVQRFLEKHSLLAGDIDADGLIAEFLTEMEAGLAGLSNLCYTDGCFHR